MGCCYARPTVFRAQRGRSMKGARFGLPGARRGELQPEPLSTASARLGRGATGRYSSGGVRRHRPKPRGHRPDFLRAPAVPVLETAVTFSREGGTGWDASAATRLVRAALCATPTMRMAPSRSNFPHPAPTTASKREEKAVTSGRSTARPATGDTCARAFGHHLGPPNCRSVRACAVKPCAFGAPLTRLWGLTARHGQTRGIRALREISMPIADLAGEWATARPSPRPLMPP